MNSIYKLFAIVLIISVLSCKKSESPSDPITLKGSEWRAINEELIVTLNFVNDSVCTITTGSAKPGVIGLNLSQYKYERAFGIDLMLFNNSSVEYVAKFLYDKKLSLSKVVGNQEIGESILLSQLK